MEKKPLENIKVFCRFCPFSEDEKEQKQQENITITDTTINIPNPSQNYTYNFEFDKVFSSEANEETIYETVALPIVESVIQGFSGTIIAYGETFSGKTYTIQGKDSQNHSSKGITSRALETIFSNREENYEYTYKISCYEIFEEKIWDLLEEKEHLRIREDNFGEVFLENLSEYEFFSEIEAKNHIKSANLHLRSSKSDLVIMITIMRKNLMFRVLNTGKLILVDLAGSEKIAKTEGSGERLEEAKKIGKSLEPLGLVVSQLTDPKSCYIPYRESKLTRVLKNALGGNEITALIVNCSLKESSYNNTLSSLRFGHRAKFIKNRPTVNSVEITEIVEEAISNSLEDSTGLITSEQIECESERAFRDETELVGDEENNEIYNETENFWLI